MKTKELVELLKQYPQDAEVVVLHAGKWDDGEKWGNDPEEVELDPEEDIVIMKILLRIRKY